MKIFYLVLLGLAVLAVAQGAPRRRLKFTKGNAGSSGHAEGDETGVNTKSKVNAGGAGKSAMGKGHGLSKGYSGSAVDLRTWAGFGGLLEGEAGGGGNALGDETEVETESEVLITDNTAQAHADTDAAAKGSGKSAFEVEAFGDVVGWGSGTASGAGHATGDISGVDSHSGVDSEVGRGTMARSRGKGGAISRGKLSVVDLKNFAGIEDSGPSGEAGATSIGNRANGKTSVCTTQGADGSISVCSKADADAEASGRGGSSTDAEASDGQGLAVNSASQGRGEADLVVSESGSQSGLTNTDVSGSAHTATNSRGKNSSFSESVSDVVIDENAEDQPAESD